MVDIATLATLFIAVIASAFMSWSIGAGSSGSTPFAPAVGANAISIMRAGLLVGILCLAGAVLQGQNVTEAVGQELIIGEELSAQAAAIALSLAAALVAFGVFTGYPIATAFTVTGAVIGVGLAMGGAPAWEKYAEIGAMWILTPFIGGGVAYAVARFLREYDSPSVSMSLVGAVVGAMLVNIEFAVLGSNGDGSTIAAELSAFFTDTTMLGISLVTLVAAGLAGGILYQRTRTDRVTAQRRFLILLGSLVAFSAGGSQVGLAIGPLLPLLEPFSISITLILFGGGLGLLIGSWTGAPRMIKAISQDYSSLGPRRSIAALVPSFAIAQTAVLFGIPISFNEIIISAIIGSGYAVGGSSVSRRKMGITVLAWIASFVAALTVGYGAYTVTSLI